jgi:hypothetical protein
MHRGVVKPSVYGADTTIALRIADANGNVINDELHADIAKNAATQLFDAVKRGEKPYTPTQMVDALRQAFASNEKDYVIAVQQPGIGGHAMVPIGLEDQGGGKFDILLYDNNFPYVPGRPEYANRRLKVDVNADTWEYYLSVRPDVPTARWHGQGMDNRMSLISSALNDTPTPCPICPSTPRSSPTMIALGGDPGTTGHLRITDRQGRVTGWNGSRFVNEIPGAEVRFPRVIQRADVAPEPYIEVPRATGYTIEQVEIPSGATPATLNVTGPTVNAGLARADEGTKLTLAAGGTVALRAAAGSELTLAAPGDREVRLTPTTSAVSVRPVGDDVRIAGRVDSATAVNPESGEEAEIEGSGRADLGSLVGTP